jgi:hypothetical protein
MEGISDVDVSALANALKGGDTKLILTEARKLKSVGKDILGFSYLNNPMQVARTFSMAEAKIVNEAVGEKLKGWGSLSLANQKKKLEFEIDWVEKNKKYSTWKVAQDAYVKQLAVVSDKMEWEGLNSSLKQAFAFKTQSKPYAILVKQLEDAINSKNKILANKLVVDIQSKQTALDKAALARQAKKSGKATPRKLADMDSVEIQRLLDLYQLEDINEADRRLRGLAEQQWKLLSNEERLVLTKYTQTYHYLNEPLRGIPYYGSLIPNAEHIHDLPILTSALEKFRMPQNTVVRRGVNDYVIKELGCILSKVKVGDVFVDKGFLSTSIHRDKGFRMRYNLVICVPKGASGFYAEPFSHFTDKGKFDYKSNNLWDGKSIESMGGEVEWIGQRGSQFKVLKRSGNTIYLQMIGQLQ